LTGDSSPPPNTNVVGVVQIVAAGKPAPEVLSSTVASAGTSASTPSAPSFIHCGLAVGAG
jgi:hypothetical protein